MITYKREDSTGPSYEGCCLEPYTQYSVRIMSDVWTDIHGVVVWDESEGKPLRIQTSSGEFGASATYTLDATPEIVAKYEAWKAADEAEKEERRLHREAAEAAFRQKQAEADARKDLIESPTKGDTVVVVRGRKVPKGTVGVVRWEGGNDYGPRIGIAVEGEEKLVYTSPSNVEVVFPGLKPGQTPTGGWKALWDRIQNERLLPRKGDVVRTKDGVEGKVMWVQPGTGTRLGFKVSRKSDPIWVDTNEVVRVDNETTTAYVTDIVATADGEVRPLTTDADALLAAASPVSDAEAKAADEYLARKERVAHLVAPFCDIRSVVPAQGQICWEARGEDGVLIATLPAATALEIKNLLEGTAS